MKRRPALFEPVRVGSLKLSNRIVIAPMCQYSAENGCMNDWHLIHLGHLSISGAALLTVEATAVLPDGRIPVGPSYQVPLARAVKTAVRIPVIAVGLITGFDQAEAIVATREADMVALARTILYDPRWPWHAAAELGAQVQAPKQYLRSQPRRFRDLLVANSSKRPAPPPLVHQHLRTFTS